MRAGFPQTGLKASRLLDNPVDTYDFKRNGGDLNMKKRAALRTIASALTVAGLMSASAAYADWWKASTGHFTVYSESNRDDAEAFARKLERFDNALRTLQNMPIVEAESDASKVTVYRFGDTDDIAKLAGAPGSGIAGFYIPRAGDSVLFTPYRDKVAPPAGSILRRSDHALDAESVLKHEYTHSFMLQNFPATYPGWYVEGFAELYATIALKDDGTFHVGDPPQYRARDFATLGLLPVRRMLDLDQKLSDMERYQFYSSGSLLAHYLNFEPTRRGQVARYLKLLEGGGSSLESAKEIFGDLGALDKELSKYRRGRLYGYDVKPGDYVPPTVELHKLTQSEENIMRARLRLARGGDKKELVDIASDIDSLSIRYPNSLEAQLIVAQANVEARRVEQADAAASRALALDPNSLEANLYKGMAYIGQGKADSAAFAKARPYLVKASSIDSRDPRPLIQYYLSYYEAKDGVPEDAIIGLEKAYDFASYDEDYRLILARQLLDEGKGKLAKSVLAPIAFSAHRSTKENKPTTIIESIDGDNIADARVKMAEIFQDKEDRWQGRNNALLHRLPPSLSATLRLGPEKHILLMRSVPGAD